jgi:curved DNA-binding protein CbpA
MFRLKAQGASTLNLDQGRFGKKRDMNLREAFQMLELDRNASIEEAKQAYKDLANIWHPDRFSNNPRLKQKAEEKLKRINAAYETVLSSLSSDGRRGAGAQRKSGSDGKAAREEMRGRDTTEAMAESATRMVLSAWSYLSETLRRIADQMAEGSGEKEPFSKRGRERRKGAGKRKG